MDELRIVGTARTPSFVFTPDGSLTIEGRSIPENAIELYKPAMDWLEMYVQNASSETVMNMKLEYFNTSSSKILLNMFKKLAELSETGKKVRVNWYYQGDDDDMYETGEDYRQIVKIPVELVRLD